MPLQRIVIAGASLAGLRAAESLRSLGFEGSIALIGDEDCLPYDRPPLSKEVLRGDWDADKIQLVRDRERFDALELELHLGRRATSLDTAAKQVSLDDGNHVTYDGLVIATGASPRKIPGTPELPGIYTLRTLDDCLAIRAELERGPRVAVVGAGFIGAEVAATCRKRGLAVAMIEMLPVPLAPIIGEDVGARLAQRHRDEGVDLRCGVGVDAIEGGERVERVKLADGSVIEADVVIIGVGVAPNTQWLEGSGLDLDNGVVCDERCATSVPDVVACGDVARWQNPLFDEAMRIEHWSNATEMAHAAAQRLVKGPECEPFASVPFFWSDQYDVKIQSAGRLSGADETVVVDGSIEEQKFVKLYGKAGRLIGALSFNEPRKLIKYRRVLREVKRFDDAVAEAQS